MDFLLLTTWLIIKIIVFLFYQLNQLINYQGKYFMKVIIVNDKIINFNNVSYVTYSYSPQSPHHKLYGLIFIFNYGYYDSDVGINEYLHFPCSKEEYQKIHKKIIDFLKDKDETILELNINEK